MVSYEKIVGEFTPCASDSSITSAHIKTWSLINNYDIEDQQSQNGDENTKPKNDKKSKNYFGRSQKCYLEIVFCI